MLLYPDYEYIQSCAKNVDYRFSFTRKQEKEWQRSYSDDGLS